MEHRDGLLKVLRGDFFDLSLLTDVPTAGYATLLIARQNHSSIFTVYPASEFSGRCVDMGFRGDGFVPWDDIVLDIGDEKKQVAFEPGSNGVFAEKI